MEEDELICEGGGLTCEGGGDFGVDWEDAGDWLWLTGQRLGGGRLKGLVD